ncbi:MAG TPA: TonB-dependent receptor [Bryobacteraceae bacterium]|nr:TonB-dependent receptor [Bryobacteraceae bacterium]
MTPSQLAAIAAVALLASASAAAPPETKPWTGVLRDSQRQPIAGATVRLHSANLDETATTAKDGAFTFAALPPAEYSIAIEYHGITATCPQPVQLPRDTAAVLELSAGQTGQSGQTLALLDDSPKHEATGGQALSAKAVSELPLNKRDFSALLLLAAGTMTDTNGAANFTQQFAVNGQRGTAAVFAMDGADSSDPEMGGATFTNFNVDAVEEIRSSSGWMPAEIGRGASGFTDIVTRSGTNAIHGSVFEFLRNAALDARNFFDERSIAQPGRIPPFIRNEFGLTSGGPVVIPGVYDGRNRTFYFAEYQGFRQVLGDTEVIPVPTAAERSGLDTTAFPGDTLIVPVDPRIARLLARYPLPNDPSGPYAARTFATSSKVTTVSDQFSVRLDHQISDKSRLFGRFTMANVTGPTTNPSQTAIDPEFAVGFLDRQRNGAVAYTRAPSPTFTMESGISFTRTTPSFPTLDRTDPALSFGDGSYEAFNAAAGSVMAAYGNLFQIRQSFQWIRGKHTLKAGGEVRGNRDTTLFGISPNGAYQFGGGTAYATVPIRSSSGMHDIAIGDPLPDALTGLLSASAFAYSEAVAPPMFSQGASIGDSALHRDAYNLYFQDAWKVSGHLTLNYGLRYEIESRIREADDRTSAPVLGLGPGTSPGAGLLINPSPAYKLDPNGWGPRLSLDWRAAPNTTVHIGGAITTLLVNLWQDNLLTGSTPFVVYPHVTAAPGQPISFGAAITPQELPTVYTIGGAPVFASGDSKQVPPNTVMDVLRYEQDLAAVSPGHQITPLSVAGISPGFRNGYIATWTAGVEHRLGGANLSAGYVGTAGIKLPAMDFPNGFAGAAPAFAPYTQFNSSGQITGGYGPVTVITNRSHSSYHALQVSVQQSLTSSGLGFQASYTFSKSIDDTSAVIGGFISGQSGAVAQTAPEDPFDARLDKGPSNFDVKNALAFSLFQDLHADRVPFLRPLGRPLTAGWQMLGIGTLQSGSPFTIYSGIQQTGVGSMGTDRPDQIGTPVLSTSRKVREDYFGLGANNASFFSIPIDVPGGTGPNDGVFGTLGRNTFRGPGLHDFDLALIKDTPLFERAGAARASLQFRVEFFNVFNIVNFGLPSNIVLGPGFGEISRTAGNSRQIQFSLKMIY